MVGVARYVWSNGRMVTILKYYLIEYAVDKRERYKMIR
jgi:hypothetical protein